MFAGHEKCFLAWHLKTDVSTLCAQSLLLQFYSDQFETLRIFLSCSVDEHVVLALSCHFFTFELSHLWCLSITVNACLRESIYR